MRKLIIALVAVTIILVLCSANAVAASTDSQANSSSASDAGAVAATGAITFEASPQRGHTSISTTPAVYVPPSMFGGQNNCGMSDTASVSVTGFGFGGSRATESDACNTRQDTATAWNLGLKDVAILRFMCFGEDANRMAYEAAGNRCPEGATAKGLQQTASAPRGRMASQAELAAMYGN